MCLQGKTPSAPSDIRELYNDSSIILNHCGTDNMPADIFTKALDCIKLSKFARLIGLLQT